MTVAMTVAMTGNGLARPILRLRSRSVHHSTARLAIARILTGSGLAENATALVLACRLHDDATCPDDVRRTILERCLAADVDSAAPYAHPLNQQPVPEDEAGLCAQLVPALIAHPADPAMNASALWSLVQLWPHCGADERPVLRTSLLNSITARRSADGAALTSFQLREWQKKVPTHYGTLTPSVASLRGVLDTDDALAAYLLLAEHLGMQVDLETLCWVLGSLTVHLLHETHDMRGELAGLLLGMTACERLVPLVPTEGMVTVISQLNHRLWWLRLHGRLRPIRKSLDQSQRPFVPAIATGDITQAQRAARALISQQPTMFWGSAWQAISEWLPADQRSLLRLLTVLDAARWRADDNAVALDDATSVAALLAELAWRRIAP